MSFFQKVMTTMSNLTQPTIKGYDIDKEPVCSGGLQGQWKIHKAQKSDKTKLLASAFIIQKSQIVSTKEPEREEILALYKREAMSIARLRHPAILSLQEAIQDDKTQLAFVTERVECSLAAALAKPELFQEHCSSDIELQMHLLELADSLQFLHNDVRLAHLDLNPNSIFITSSGQWKLASLAFSQQIVNKNELIEAQNIDFSNKSKINPFLNFTSPELLQSISKCNYNSDIFSFGMVILRLLKQRMDKISFPEFHSVEDYLAYVQRLPQVVNSYTKYYPHSLIEFLSKMLHSQPNSRPTIEQFQQIDWFKDPLLQAFNLLNKITSLDQAQQINFIKGLQKVIFSFEPTLLRKRIFPTILELTRYDYISPWVLKILIDAMKRDDIFEQNAFLLSIWPKIKQVTQGKEIPAQALFDLVSNLQVFHKYISIEELQSSLVPLMIKCYECKIPKIQDIAVRVTPYIVTNSDYTFTKTKILPRILSLCCDTNAEVRKISLICLYKIIDVIDRNYLCDQVLITLDKVKSVGTDRQINQIILKIYQKISKTLSVELIATKILPQITPFLMESQLSKCEFDDYILTLRSLLDRIQEERYKTLDNSTEQSISAQDMNLELPEVKKQQIVTGGEQFDFLQQFNQQPKQNNGTGEQQQPIPQESYPQLQVQSDSFGFKQQQIQPDSFGFKQQQVQPEQQQPIQSLNVVIPQIQKINLSGSINGPDPFANFNNPIQTPADNDPWASLNDQNTKKLSQRPMFNQKQSQMENNSPLKPQMQTQVPYMQTQTPQFQTQAHQFQTQAPQFPTQVPQMQTYVPQMQTQAPQQQTQVLRTQQQQPQKLNYDPFAELGQPSAQDVWKQPSVKQQEKRTYEAFDLI